MDSSKGLKLLEPDVQKYMVRNNFSQRKIRRFIKEQNDYPRIPKRISRHNLETIDSYEGEF